MPLPETPHADQPGVPPIVLLVDDDVDTLDMYGSYFESAGLWVAVTTDPEDALNVAAELKPNLVVADLGFGDQPRGLELVCTLKHDQELCLTPVIVLSGRPKDELRQSAACGADLVLAKPIPPQTLLDRAYQLLAAARGLRGTPDVSRPRVQEDLPSELTARAGVSQSTSRRCPACGSMLEWLERATLDAVEYDYFRWCEKGCGLYCYERHAARWVKLA